MVHGCNGVQSGEDIINCSAPKQAVTYRSKKSRTRILMHGEWVINSKFEKSPSRQVLGLWSSTFNVNNVTRD